MVFQRHAEGLCHCVQRMLFLPRQKNSGNAHRIHISKIVGNPLSVTIFHNKAHIEPGVMSHQNTALAKLQKPGQHYVDLLRPHYHIICYSCKLLNLKGNGRQRINKCGKTIHNLTLTDLHRANFYNAVFCGRKSCRLNIKNHEICLEILPLLVSGDLMQIVHKIGLHAVNHLKESLLVRRRLTRLLTAVFLRLPEILPHMVRIRERLYHAVVGNGDGRMSPLVSPLYDILCLGHPVHIAHLRMTVKLHPLPYASVLSGSGKIRYLLNTRQRTDGQLMVKPVHHGHAFDLDKGPFFHNVCYF